MIIFRLADGRNSLYQWDSNVQVEIIVEAGKNVTEAHFAHSLSSDETLSVEVSEKDGKYYAYVPNILLQKARKIICYAYVSSEDGNKTIAHHFFNVIPRQKPADYVYTETEIKNWSNLEKRIRDLEKGGGSGSGSGGGGLFIVTVTKDSEGNYISDKTFEEIKTAVDSGMNVRCFNEGIYFDLNVDLSLMGGSNGYWFDYISSFNLNDKVLASYTLIMMKQSDGSLSIQMMSNDPEWVKEDQGSTNQYSTLVTDSSGNVVPTPTYIQYVTDGDDVDLAGYALSRNAIIYTKGGSFKAFGVDVTLPSKEAPYPVCLVNPYPDTMGWFRWIVTPFARYAVDAANVKFYKESPNMEFITSNNKWTVFGRTSTYSRALEENVIYFCTTDVTLYSSLTNGEADSFTSTFDLKMGDTFYLGINTSNGTRTLYFINKNPNYESIVVDAKYAPYVVTANNPNYLDVINIPSGKETVLNASQVTSTQLLLENGKTYMCGKSVKISLGGSYYDTKSKTNVINILLPEGDLFKFTVSENIYVPGFYVDSYFTGTKIFISTSSNRIEYSYASGVNPYSLTIKQSSGSTAYDGNTAVTLDLTGYQTTADLTTDDANTLVEEVFG